MSEKDFNAEIDKELNELFGSKEDNALLSDSYLNKQFHFVEQREDNKVALFNKSGAKFFCETDTYVNISEMR